MKAEKTIASVVLVLTGLLSIVSAAFAQDMAPFNPSKTEKKEEFRIRDPFVHFENGKYWLYESKPWSGGRGVFYRVSTDLENWTEKRPAMVLPADVPVTAVWAPEMHKYNGRYYLFTTITEARGSRPMKTTIPGRKSKDIDPRGTWVFVADKPEGPFLPVKKGPVPPLDFQTLDGTLYVEDGKPYMVYCHEWCQLGNGTIEYAQLSPDFSGFVTRPVTLLDARSAIPGADKVTDGPFFYRSKKSSRLFMIWSNFIKDHGYCVLVRSSPSGKIAGPWTKDELLVGGNGGHGMIFEDKDDALRLTLHRPNTTPNERMKLFTLAEDGTKLSVLK